MNSVRFSYFALVHIKYNLYDKPMRGSIKDLMFCQGHILITTLIFCLMQVQSELYL